MLLGRARSSTCRLKRLNRATEAVILHPAKAKHPASSSSISRHVEVATVFGHWLSVKATHCDFVSTTITSAAGCGWANKRTKLENLADYEPD